MSEPGANGTHGSLKVQAVAVRAPVISCSEGHREPKWKIYAGKINKIRGEGKGYRCGSPSFESGVLMVVP